MIKFDKKAMQKFNQIPDDIKSKILSNVYCSNCKDMVRIVEFEASMDRDNLVLKGKCESCSSNVARLIEGSFLSSSTNVLNDIRLLSIS